MIWIYNVISLALYSEGPPERSVPKETGGTVGPELVRVKEKSGWWEEGGENPSNG